MNATEIKANLNKKVVYKNEQAGIETEYILTGAIYRKNESGFYYQAEIKDVKSNNSLIICKLDDITPVGTMEV